MTIWYHRATIKDYNIRTIPAKKALIKATPNHPPVSSPTITPSRRVHPLKSDNLLLLSRVDHTTGILIRHLASLLVQTPIRGLLLLLNQIAKTAAAGGRDISQAAALKVVLGPDIGTLHGQRHPVEADAG